MEIINEALATDVPLPIRILSELGKGSLQNFFRNTPEASEPSRLFALWRKLVLTTTSPQVVNTHITAACNALCVYLNGGSSSALAEIRDFVHSEETWFDAFQCCHKAFGDGKTKPAFQVLESLCHLLKDIDQDTTATILKRAALPLIRVVLLSSPRSDLKKACLILTCFVRKTPILGQLEPLVRQCTELHYLVWMRLLARYNIPLEQISQLGGGSITDLFLALTFAMTDHDTRTSALKLRSTLCSSDSKLEILAQSVVELYLESNQSALGDFAENVLPTILNTKEKLMGFVEPYVSSGFEDETMMAVFLAVLKVGRLQGLLSEQEILEIFRVRPTRLSDNGPDYSRFKRLMATASPEIRILAYNLLTSSPSGNAPVPSGVLNCILSSLDYLHDDADAHERSEILSTTRRLLKRIQSSFLSLRKSATSRAGLSESKTIEAEYKSFECRLYNFLKAELRAGVSYPRHSLSLRSLQYFFDTTIAPDVFENDRELAKSLCCLVLDPFEEVRSTASTLLQFLAVQVPDLVSGAISAAALNRIGVVAAKTIRGDHADGLGRLWAVSGLSHKSTLLSSPIGHETAAYTGLSQLISLLKQLTSTSGDLRPGSKHPIHAYLLAVHYRLRDLQAHGDEQMDNNSVPILNICVKVWDHVRTQLCVDSPETSSEPEDEDTNEGPKDLLAYSWRALRDSSLVIQSLIIATKPSRVLYSAIGDLCMDQLISLRHRGAFSTVAQTFTLCCDKVRASPDAATRELIEAWYTIALHQIDEQSDRLTRRSAGLPAMMVALLSPADNTFFSVAISDLMDVAKRPTGDGDSDAGNMKLPQVHALNCLKEVMTNSRFSAVVVQYLSGILALAANCLSSRIWAIRNCGLMLLRACINRLDSTSVNEASNHVDQLANREASTGNPFMIAVRLLGSATDSANNPDSATEHVFAALDLIGHVHPDEAMADETNNIILRQLSNSTWAVRDHAASLLATRLSGLQPSFAMKKLIGEPRLSRHENEAHGMLLCCKYILTLAGGATTEPEVKSVVDVLLKSTSREEIGGRSPYVRAAFLDVLNETAALILSNSWDPSSLENAFSFESFQSSAVCNSVHWPYLLRRILLYRTYLYMLRDVSSSFPDQEESSLITSFLAAPDSLRYLLDVIKAKHCKAPARAMIRFLVILIHQGYDELCSQPDILHQAFSCLAHSLEHARDIPVGVLQQISGNIGLDQLASTRELGNMAIELEAFLLGIEPPSHGGTEAASRTKQWLSRVEFAAADLLDFPTRLSAARALSRYAGSSKGLQGLGSTHEITLRLLLVLYDLLNDDDEEVRFEAVQATREFQLRRSPAMENLGLCAFAARELLLNEINQRYLGTEALSYAAITKLMKVGQNGEGPVDMDVITAPFQTPVASSLRVIFKGKDDLFAEERQNLYIDDLREINVWTQILYLGGLRFLTPEQTEEAIQWTLEGVKQILRILQMEQRSSTLASNSEQHDAEEMDKDSTFSHPLGATYDHEIMVVFLRVVSLARILLADGISTVVFDDLREQLERVRVKCLDAQVNEVLLGAVNLALVDQ
ncbi:hypothetical protein A1O3_02267 [Capronia epimyces CBS 606.96]|uniref:Uncharacterized protein n=1 Tax=Capronia epimyces CBS 606.96 TaxID=1182542 RepID=W9YIX1_9EURO|nr:uncharacterized protein A1O3_02267 [Capronia epimyces CBS 606.96]EXJ89201.1 hypothetical protein A1O3_02267 [Capronia epimyces CBS 606.96]